MGSVDGLCEQKKMVMVMERAVEAKEDGVGAVEAKEDGVGGL